jgi:HK97 family phage prohead protease
VSINFKEGDRDMERKDNLIENIDTFDMPFEVKESDVTPEGVFKGIASPFGGKPDDGGDIVAQGAFTKTLAAGGRNGTGVLMLRDHDRTRIPGIWKILDERKQGLFVEGQLAVGDNETPLGDETHKLMRMGAIQHLSMGYKAIEFEIDERRQTRTLKEVDLWEISILPFPMATRAKITGVKSLELIKEAKTVRELENALREVGLSKNVTKHIVKLCTPSLREEGEACNSSNVKELLTVLQQANDGLTALR